MIRSQSTTVDVSVRPGGNTSKSRAYGLTVHGATADDHGDNNTMSDFVLAYCGTLSVRRKRMVLSLPRKDRKLPHLHLVLSMLDPAFTARGRARPAMKQANNNIALESDSQLDVLERLLVWASPSAQYVVRLENSLKLIVWTGRSNTPAIKAHTLYIRSSGLQSCAEFKVIKLPRYAS